MNIRCMLKHLPESLSVILCCVILCSTSSGQQRPNILLIAVDDLNDWVSCLGGHPQGNTPHMDQLAQQGTLFSNAHCQAPICNPSRTSVMYGMRPHRTGVYMNAPLPWTVPAFDEYVSLPRHFAAHGYLTLTTGKLYHGSRLPEGDFDIIGPRPGQRLQQDARLIPPSPEGAKGLWDFGAQQYELSQFQDHQDATWAIGKLSEQPADAEKPFLLSIGFYRPHVPFYAPPHSFAPFPLQDIQLPAFQSDDRNDIPNIAWDVAVSPAAPAHQWFVDSNHWKRAVQAYLACIHWTDEQVGRVLQALKSSPHADNTIVVLYSDHGFFLGEKQRWAKQSLWERATRVPLVIKAPGIPPQQACSRPTELLSIYPTLCDLCGIPVPDQLQGVSLTPLLRNTAADWDRVALTTHGAGNHAVRDDRYRLIHYRDGSEELYDLQDDPHEWTNQAGNPQFSAIRNRLADHLPPESVPPARAATNRKRRN